jgi:hypothetical protein
MMLYRNRARVDSGDQKRKRKGRKRQKGRGEEGYRCNRKEGGVGEGIEERSPHFVKFIHLHTAEISADFDR